MIGGEEDGCSMSALLMEVYPFVLELNELVVVLLPRRLFCGDMVIHVAETARRGAWLRIVRMCSMGVLLQVFPSISWFSSCWGLLAVCPVE